MNSKSDLKIPWDRVLRNLLNGKRPNATFGYLEYVCAKFQQYWSSGFSMTEE